eukprot:scaffold37696_cov31-Phaeocystis_antarctica.AAC.1
MSHSTHMYSHVHAHVALANTRLFLSRSRLDRNHSCTHSTHVLALVETFAWWSLACFWRWRVNALDSAEENGCARTVVGAHHPGRSVSLANAFLRFPLMSLVG